MIFAKCCLLSKRYDESYALLVNHLGYNTKGAKTVVFQTKKHYFPGTFSIIDHKGNVVYTGNFKGEGFIANWSTGNAYVGDFSDFQLKGNYRIKTKVKNTSIKSEVFQIDDQVIASNTLKVLTMGIYSQRAAGQYNEADKQISFYGNRDDIIDVSGGWYDATGDRGKYLSHLSYANYMNPQQAPMVVWNFLEAYKRAKNYNGFDSKEIRKKMIEESLHGADWLVKMQDSEGYFYINVFANWSWDPGQREICAYKGQKGHKNDDYEAGYREGGGMSIAALARAAGDGFNGEFPIEKYLESAIKGFDHLEENNHLYIADGKENIIDDYCALMASTELYYATSKERFINAARKRMESLANRLTDDDDVKGYWRAGNDNKRPYFHAAEAGLPVISLVRYIQVEYDNKYIHKAVKAIQRSIAFELDVTCKVNNPFGYARQYIKSVNEDHKRTSFFMPQNNETGYWWQGENARLASLAAAARLALPYLNESQKKSASQYSTNQINWILGLNPYDMCMLQGKGRNNPSYKEGGYELNVDGCVCNGITTGFRDESDISFRPKPYSNDPSQKWRWPEQWLQHGSWLLLAISSYMAEFENK